MKDIIVAITAASYSGNKGAAAMLQSSIQQLYAKYGEGLNINLMSVYPEEDSRQIPWDFIKVVPCKPEQLIFIAFPMAILYKIFSWCLPIKKMLLKNTILKTYSQTDMVLDEAGISFVDSRGFVMNMYAFICAAVPILLGVPVVKYSQAMGTFHSFTNRSLAKWILPKLRLICARGEGTLDNLAEIGIKENVRLCADGAFTMEDSLKHTEMVEAVAEADDFYQTDIVGLSISSVVEKKCKKLGIDYKQCMVEFIQFLTEEGYGVLIIANGARINSQKSRNNDLPICDAVYKEIKDKSKVRWYYKEMDAEEVRDYIGKCRFLVASRFHAMVGALQKKVPVLLVGWSHKYQEVLDFFELGKYATDFSHLNIEDLKKTFHDFVNEEYMIRRNIEKNYESVMESSRKNIRYISEVIDGIVDEKQKNKKRKILDYRNPSKYMGEYVTCRKGYAADETIRSNAASGGMVTALLCHLLRTGQIDGAWVTRSEIKEGKLSYKTFIATTEEEVRSASSSIYMHIAMLKHMDMVKKFNGKIAVVLVPCMMENFCRILEKDRELSEKIVLKLGLYCSGGHSDKATYLSMEQAGIDLDGAVRMYYRRGHWRGISSVIYENGDEKSFSYTKTICSYKNAYFFEKDSCMTCQDQFAYAADISFGDIWLKEMKGNEIKHTSCVIRSQRAWEFYKSAVEAGDIIDSHISGKDMVRSQKRALVFKYSAAEAKKKAAEKDGRTVKLDCSDKCKWNHRLAYYLAEKNKRYSEEHYEQLRKIPYWIIYYYMCFIRVLLSF